MRIDQGCYIHMLCSYAYQLSPWYSVAAQILNWMPFLFLSGFLFSFKYIQFMHFHCDILDLVHFQLLLIQKEATVGNQQDLALKISQLQQVLKYTSVCMITTATVLRVEGGYPSLEGCQVGECQHCYTHHSSYLSRQVQIMPSSNLWGLLREQEWGGRGTCFELCYLWG